MSNTGRVPRDESLSPGDWPTEAERQYARLQGELADVYGVDFDSVVTDVEGVGHIHYLTAGDPDGEPVLLLHGLSATAAMWLPMFDALTDEYYLVAPDRPGRGLSVAPSFDFETVRPDFTEYLVGVLDTLDVDRPHVVGNSLGGLQAFLLTIDHGHTDRLCLVGAPGGLTRDLPFTYRLLTVPGLNRVLSWLNNRGDPIENSKESVGQFVVDDSEIPEVFYEMSVAASDLPGRAESFLSFASALGRRVRMHPVYDIRDEIVAIERPTSFIWGEEDWFMEPDFGRPVVNQMPDAKLHALDDHGHIPWLEPGDETERLLRAFLDND